MLISIKDLRRLVSEAVEQLSPEEMARRIWSVDALDEGERMTPQGAPPEQIADVVSDYAIETSLSSTRRNQLGSAYMRRLKVALVALTMKELGA